MTVMTGVLNYLKSATYWYLYLCRDVVLIRYNIIFITKNKGFNFCSKNEAFIFCEKGEAIWYRRTVLVLDTRTIRRYHDSIPYISASIDSTFWKKMLSMTLRMKTFWCIVCLFWNTLYMTIILKTVLISHN